MKNIFSFLLIMAMAMSFTACGGDDDPKPKEEDPEDYVWTGDWNNPADDAYKAEYNGKYNPIKGLWEYEGESRARRDYTDDFKRVNYSLNYKTGEYEERTTSDYIINDKAFKMLNGLNQNSIFLYKIEGNILTLYWQGDGWRKYKKVEWD